MTEEKIEKRIEIYKGLSGEVVFDVDAEAETIWATQAQMAQLFGVDRTVIGRHIRNIIREKELDESRVCAKNAHTTKHGAMTGKTQTREVNIYNLDMIISVGYRVNSKKATNFRIWATSVLKRYITDGVAVNERRLEELQAKKDVKRLREVEKMMSLVRRLTTSKLLDAGEANGVLEVISRYAGSFKTLKEYDEGYIDLSFMKKKGKSKDLTVAACVTAVNELKRSVKGGELFGKQRNNSFEGSLSAIFQSFDKRELYPSIAEKAAHLLYFVIKDHPFYDGNKRIGALLFVLFLTLNDFNLTDKGETKISDRALTAIALLIAESEPSEKELIVSLICKLLE